jgi:hypothetical protein
MLELPIVLYYLKYIKNLIINLKAIYKTLPSKKNYKYYNVVYYRVGQISLVYNFKH